MADRRILYLTAVMGSLAFFIAYQKWFSWIVLLAVLLLPWFSLLMSLVPMFRTKLKLKAPEKVQRGSTAKIRLAVNCPGIRPPFRCRIRVTHILTGESRILRHGEPLPTEHCGGLLIQPERAKVSDYLGLFSRKLKKLPTAVVRVMPSDVKMTVPPDLTRHLARAWKPKQGGGYAENHEIRPYRPGDSLNLVHWKLSAKVDSLMLREPMEPDQGLMLLTMDLCGTPEELDRKMGRLLWLGKWLLDQEIYFAAAVLTLSGLESWTIRKESDLTDCVDRLLCARTSPEGTLRDLNVPSAWQYHIGGEPDEG